MDPGFCVLAAYRASGVCLDLWVIMVQFPSAPSSGKAEC